MDTHGNLFEWTDADPDFAVTVDLEAQAVELPDGRKSAFPIDSFSRQCLLEGGDQLSYIQQRMDAITAYERVTANALDTLA